MIHHHPRAYNMTNEIVEGTVLDSMPAPAQQTALVANPFERMAMAMVTGGGNLDNLERLLDLQQKWDHEQARKAYDADMAACQAVMPRAHKDRYNEQTKSWYATLESVVKSAQPVYAAHGFSLSFNTAESKFPNHVLIKCKCSHRAGHSENFEYEQPLDDAGIAGTKNKTPTHAKGSAVSYGRRYITMMVFNIATTDDDDGNASSKIKPDDAKPSAEAATAKGSESPEAIARKKEAHDRVYAKNQESVDFMRDLLERGDVKGAANEWWNYTQDEQTALFLATTKGGIFTTAQRKVIKEQFGQYNPARIANQEAAQ
jgi:hypothetical protein